MEKQAPTLPRLLTMVVFALSCFGLLLYLWVSFGGTTPLEPKGWRFEADFPQAVSLSEQADVRISGVNVGKVVKLARQIGRTRATIQLDSRYAPLPRDTQAILRSKTLLGETYVALSPGSRSAPKLREDAVLPSRNVHAQIELDEVLRAFDKPTRSALHRWMSSMSASLHGRSSDLSDVLGDLGPTATRGADLLSILDSQHAAVRRLVSDTGQVFSTIGSRAGEVQGLITAGDRLFATTAKRNRALSDTLAALPPFMAQTRRTLRTAQAAATEAAPVIHDLEPVAPLVKPALTDTAALAPDAERLFRRTDPVITLSRTALPAASQLLRAAGPLVDVLLPVSEDLVPVVRFLNDQRDQLVAGQSNVPAALNAGDAGENGTFVHYLRAITWFGPEGVVGYSKRLPSNRRNPYLRNRGLEDLRPGSAIKTYDCDNVDNPQTAPPPDSPPPCQVESSPFPAEFGGGKFPHLTRDAP
jgi:phospholipid/cholesterol/gamma-HCH transport system substrate-binding protein